MTAKKQVPVTPVPPKERRTRRTMSQNDMLAYWTETGFLIPQRVIYLGSVTTDVEGNESGVDAAMARRFEVQIRALEYFDPKASITVLMNNLGGDQYHCMAIYDRIMQSNCPVTIHSSGYVMSAGSIILQAGDKRLLSRNATMMLHYGGTGYIGHKLEFERAAEESRRLRHQMEDIYLAQMQKKDPTMTLEKLRAMLPLDLYMDAYKAVRLGLADGIIPWPKHKKIKPRQDPSVQETPLS